MLIRAQANIEQRDESIKGTPLIWAAISSANQKNKENVILILLKAGADINAKDERNNTALMNACAN